MKVRVLSDVFQVPFREPVDGVTQAILAGPRRGADGHAHLQVHLELEGAVSVTYRLLAHPPGHLALIGLNLTVPLQAGGPPASLLTAETLRRVRIGDYVRFLEPMVEHLRNTANPGSLARMRAAGFGFLLDGGLTRARMPRDREPRSRAGRPRLSDVLLARVARAYLDALQRQSAQPVVDAATRLRERPERVRDLLHRARRRGLLEGNKSGVAGGTLTMRGRALLRRHASKPEKKRGRR
jgi:hypothetical protein